MLKGFLDRNIIKIYLVFITLMWGYCIFQIIYGLK